MTTNHPGATARPTCPSRWRRSAALVALPLLVSIPEACTMSVRSANSRPTTSTAEAIRRTGIVDWSMVTPLDRATVGLAAGQTDVIYDHPGSAPMFDVHLTIADGVEIRQQMSDLQVFANGPDGPPKSIWTANRNVPLERAAALVREYGSAIGVDPGAIDAWQREAAARTSGAAPDAAPRTHAFPNHRVGVVDVELQAVAERGEDRASVYLVVSWAP